ncbi:MarR family winged helix-turn-helix transcriptional regulator [Nonomuraea purpurea]|uniref:MarR family winged helix-turn-helix transcriptional regulator n=1 Tax=Nonomuraea purpurea TaxID=1849276 RepID=A0ABV8GF77_9ACTN
MDDSRQPRWLDAEEQRSWYALAYALIRLPAALDAQMQRDAGISHFEYLVLSGLSMMPERTQRMSDLATYTASTLSRLSNVVIRLEKRGWVSRRPDPTDGRYTLATLTEDGRATVTAAAPAHVAEVRRLVFDPLTKAQQQQMGRIAQRILKTIDPEVPSIEDCFPDAAPPLNGE